MKWSFAALNPNNVFYTMKMKVHCWFTHHFGVVEHIVTPKVVQPHILATEGITSFS